MTIKELEEVKRSLVVKEFLMDIKEGLEEIEKEGATLEKFEEEVKKDEAKEATMVDWLKGFTESKKEKDNVKKQYESFRDYYMRTHNTQDSDKPKKNNFQHVFAKEEMYRIEFLETKRGVDIDQYWDMKDKSFDEYVEDEMGNKIFIKYPLIVKGKDLEYYRKLGHGFSSVEFVGYSL